jgi:spermidine synthase
VKGKPPRASAGRNPAPTGADWPLWLAILLFAGSGFSALIYEIVWFERLELVVGSSAISLGILLGTFMGGLCLGSLLLPRFVPRGAHPFRVYALLELGIAALGVLVYFAVPLIGGLYTGSGAHGIASVIVRAAFAGLCLLPPTLLMGATLPAIARWVESTPRGVGWLGIFYGGNIAGGILGCLVAGFYLLRVHDAAVATAVAVLTNIAVSAIAWVLAGRTAAHSAPEESAAAPAAPAGGNAPIYVAIALSGLCALGGEVVWTRLLSLLLGTTVYTFSIILAVYLMGLGIGSTVGASLARSSPHPRRDLGICQALLALAVAWAAFMLSRSLPYWPVAPSLTRDPWIGFQLDIVRCLWTLLPATVLWGASFPLALAAAARGQDPGRLVGTVYAANTVGAIVGALGFSFFVIPSVGTQVAQQILVALSAVVGLALLAPAVWPPWLDAARALRSLALVAAAILAAWLVARVPAIPESLIALGRYVAFRHAPGNPVTADGRDPNVLYVGEGLTQSVVVSSNGSVRVFHVSGKIEASTTPKDMRLQRMLGHIPALVHPEPRSVLIVGCGAGTTAGVFTLYPSIRRIVICEIEPLVPKKVAPFFAAENYDVVNDPRVEIVYDDARHYILTTKEKFDIITSDPIHPWVKGSAALYSQDYFELVKRHLNPGGVVTQWVPIYQASEPTVKGEIATFFESFPNGTVWANNDQGQGYDLVLLGTDSPTTIDLDRLTARLERPDQQPARQSLAEVGFPTAIDLLATYAGRRSDLAPWLADARINRDRRPWLQYQAGWEAYTEQTDDVVGAMAAYRKFPEDLFVGSEAMKRALLSGGSGAAP